MVRGQGGRESSFRYNTFQTLIRHKSGTIGDAAGHIIRTPLKATEIHMPVINIQVAFKVM